jgi:hypothetical protein
MVYILGMTVLGTVVRGEGLKHCKMSQRGHCHRSASVGKQARKAGRNSENVRRRCRMVWGTGECIWVASEALLLTFTHTACAASYQRIERLILCTEGGEFGKVGVVVNECNIVAPSTQTGYRRGAP